MFALIFRQIRVRLKIVVNDIAHKRHKYINDRNFLILTAAWVGLLSGTASVILKSMVHLIQHFLEGGFNVRYENYLYLVYPLCGILLSALYIRTFHYHTMFDKGLSSIIYAISKKGSAVERHKSWSHIFTSALTVGFGGSVGLEAPIAVTGSAIGANTAKDLLMNRKHRTLLLASGAAAGIAAIFNSPIAGVIFALEVLLTEVSIPAFIPLLIASACGAVVSKLFYSGQLFHLTTNEWNVNALPYYILLGVFCGLLSVYMVRMTTKTEHYFNRWRSPWPKAIGGGLVLGILLFFFPTLYGEGFDTVGRLMSGNSLSLFDKSLLYQYNNQMWVVVVLSGVIMLLKVFAASITIGSGGNGGIFGPSLFTGAMAGFFFSRFISQSGLMELNEQNFVAVAMCGLISGALHAPLTGIFLIAEITGGYMLFIPLMMVSAISYFVTRYFEPNSVYKKTLIERGFLSDDKDTNVLDSINIKAILETDFTSLSPEQTLRSIVGIISKSRRNMFPVLLPDKHLIGILTLEELKEVMFRTELYDSLTAADLMSVPPVRIDVHDNLADIMNLFEIHGVWNIPVTDGEQYLGFISKTGVLNVYRNNILLNTSAI